MNRKLNISKKLLIIKYVDENKTTTQIANELNCGRQTINNYLHLYKIPITCEHGNHSSGKSHWFWKGGIGRFPKCEKCGKVLSAYHCKLCSKCYTSTLGGSNNPMFGVHRFGKKSANYVHGLSYFPYTEEFNNSFKLKLRTRDNFTCQICSVLEKDCDCSLSVHHIDYNKFNNKVNNLISLCRTCHLKTNGNRNYWYAYCMYLMENK